MSSLQSQRKREHSICALKENIIHQAKKKKCLLNNAGFASQHDPLVGKVISSSPITYKAQQRGLLLPTNHQRATKPTTDVRTGGRGTNNVCALLGMTKEDVNSR